MELEKIDTNLQLPVHHQSPSERSSSPKLIPYSSGNISPESATDTNKCPSLASDRDTSSPSEDSPGSSPPNPGGHLSTALIGSSPSSNLVSPFYRHLTSYSRSGQQDQSKMNHSHGIQDRRAQLSTINPYHQRSSESSNWRASAGDAQERATLASTAASPPIATMDHRHAFPQGPQPSTAQYPPFGWPVPQPIMTTFPRTTATNFHSSNTGSGVSASALRPDPNHLLSQDFYGYGFDRGGGKITLLVPVDMLPPVAGIPQTLTDRSGIVILPPPPRRSPQGLSSNPGPLAFRNTSNTHAVGDNVQQYATNFRRSRQQSQIDSIVALATSSAQPKRTKIYCDKWIHEGVCAFTQQGCKFKHEMPMDKATQHDLGLFQGLPSWWRKHQAELQRAHRQDETSDAPICLTRSRETSPNGRGVIRERQNITAAFSSSPSAVSGSTSRNSNSPSPVGVVNSSSNRVGNPTIPSAKWVDNVHGLGASRHNENVRPGRSLATLSELGSHLPSPYGPIGTPRKSGRDSSIGRSGDANSYPMFNFASCTKLATSNNDGAN